MTITFSREALEAEGFAGFLAIGQLFRESAASAPDAPGVYVVLLAGEAPHAILPRSRAPHWRGQDASFPTETLAQRWVSGTALLFVGVAPGPGVRNRIHQRVKRFLRFGHGAVVGHWNGRAIWQLGEASRLAVAWRPCADAAEAEALGASLLERFRAEHAALPFANEPVASDDD